MKTKVFALCMALLLILPGVSRTAGVDWETLAWVDIGGEIPAKLGQDPDSDNIPVSQRDLDIIGGNGNWPGRYAVDDDFIYFEIRVSETPGDKGQWMALFFPPQITSLAQAKQGNFNSANLVAGVTVEKSGQTVNWSVILASVGSGHNLSIQKSYGSDDYIVIENQGNYLVRWRIPLDDLYEHITEPAYFTLATGIGNNKVPNRDWFGWTRLAPPAELYPLTLEVTPNGSGTVTGAGSYAQGTEVSLNAVANPGYVFVNWTDAEQTQVSDQASFTYTMPGAATTLTANFEAEPAPVYPLTLIVNPNGFGTVTGAGSYAQGTEVSLNAVANPGYVFVNWTDGEQTQVSDQAGFTYTMPGAATTLTANFEAEPAPVYPLTLIVNPNGFGTVTGAGSYAQGTEVSLNAVANPGYVFVNWTDGEQTQVSAQAGFTYTVPGAATTLTANFEAEPAPVYPLTLAVNPGGFGTVTGAGSYAQGTEVSLNAVANPGYVFVNWTDAEQTQVSAQAGFTYTMPGAATTLTANFEAEPAPVYPLTLAVNPGGFGTVTGAGSYAQGTEVSLNAAANPSYVFVNWTDANHNVVSTQPSFTYIMPAGSTTLTANFRVRTIPAYTLNLIVAPAGSGTVTGAGVYVGGAAIELKAEANSGYEFLNWTDVNHNVVSSSPEFTFYMPASDTTLTANYKAATTPTTPTTPELPVTGTDIFLLVPFGLGLIITGLILKRRVQ